MGNLEDDLKILGLQPKRNLIIESNYKETRALTWDALE